MSSVVSQWSESVVPSHSHRARSAELQQGRYPAGPEQGWPRLAHLLPRLHARFGSHHLCYPQKHGGEPDFQRTRQVLSQNCADRHQHTMNANCCIPSPSILKTKTCLRWLYTGDDPLNSRKKWRSWGPCVDTCRPTFTSRLHRDVCMHTSKNQTTRQETNPKTLSTHAAFAAWSCANSLTVWLSSMCYPTRLPYIIYTMLRCTLLSVHSPRYAAVRTHWLVYALRPALGSVKCPVA